jgi:hypothetical protein
MFVITVAGLDDAVDASDCSVLVTCATAFWAVPVDVPVAEATAAAWAPVPAGSVFCMGEVNGVSVVAAAEAPA